MGPTAERGQEERREREGMGERKKEGGGEMPDGETEAQRDWRAMAGEKWRRNMEKSGKGAEGDRDGAGETKIGGAVHFVSRLSVLTFPGEESAQ